MKRNVIDLFTRKPVVYGTQARSPHDVATFVGSIDKEIAAEVISQSQELRKQREAIDEQLREWEQLHDEHEVALDDVHMLLGLTDYDDETYMFVLDAEGFAWLVRHENIDEFIALTTRPQD